MKNFFGLSLLLVSFITPGLALAQESVDIVESCSITVDGKSYNGMYPQDKFCGATYKQRKIFFNQHRLNFHKVKPTIQNKDGFKTLSYVHGTTCTVSDSSIGLLTMRANDEGYFEIGCFVY